MRGRSREEASQGFTEAQDLALSMVAEAQGQHDSRRATIESIAAKMGCTADMLRRWIKPA